MAGFRVTVGPEGETLAVRLSAKLCQTFEAVTVILEVADLPGKIVTLAGFAVSVGGNCGDDTPCSLQAVSGCSSQPE